MEALHTSSHARSDYTLPESIPESEESFGPFFAANPQNSNSVSSTDTSISLEQQDQAALLPPDYGQSAIQMLNMEIQAHAQTQKALGEQCARAFNLERHYVHQTIVISAWHTAWLEVSAKLQQKCEENDELRFQMENLKQENESLKQEKDFSKEEIDAWRDDRRPSSV